MVAAGELGDLRVVQVEYAQDWLTEPLEKTGQKQAEWRTDPKQSGAGGASATSAPTPTTSPASSPGSKLDSLLADLTDLRPGPPARRQRPRPAALEGRRRGMLWASQVAPGNENGLTLRVYGSKGGSNGGRRTRTISGSRPTASRRA